MKAKIYYTVILFLFLVSLVTKGQEYSHEKLQKMKSNFYYSLTHENQGVVESAIFITLQFKDRYPNEDYSKFINALDDLVLNSNNTRISYKAQLARIFLKNTELFKNIKITNLEDEQKTFEEISKRLNSTTLAASF